MVATLRPGDRVRFSPVGRERVAGMPEAWGLHRALYQAQTGVVVEAEVDVAGEPRLSVEFPEGSAWGWDAACFEPAEPDNE